MKISISSLTAVVAQSGGKQPVRFSSFLSGIIKENLDWSVQGEWIVKGNYSPSIHDYQGTKELHWQLKNFKNISSCHTVQIKSTQMKLACKGNNDARHSSYASYASHA